MTDFKSYEHELTQRKRHKYQNLEHIVVEDDFCDFCGFREEEIWGSFADFDYENWLKEQ